MASGGGPAAAMAAHLAVVSGAPVAAQLAVALAEPMAASGGGPAAAVVEQLAVAPVGPVPVPWDPAI